MQIGIVGAGNMANALAKAIESAHSNTSFIAFDVDQNRLREFAAGRRCAIASSNREAVEKSVVSFLAVKPQVLDQVLPELASIDRLVVSIAAGVTIARLQDAMPKARVVRVMPNTPCLVGDMAGAFAVGERVSPDDRTLVEQLLSSAGLAIELEESLLDAVTGLSGSGPAFVADLIAWFAAAGAAQGLPEEVSHRLAVATFRGTARLLDELSLEPDALVRMVSSPNGTTVAGREVLESSDVADVIHRTVAAATRRSQELGA